MGRFRWIILINYLPFTLLIACGLIASVAKTAYTAAAIVLIWIYLVPALLTRLLYLVTGRPDSRTEAFSSAFYGWWVSIQMQMIYIRFPFLEEILRMIPGLYSLWLRIWGAKIGRFVYWSPALRIMDRPGLEIGDQVVVGYGVGFTAHHFQIHHDGKVEFVYGNNRVGERAILGGESGLGPGASVAALETLPATLKLAPFYEWREGRRHSNK